MVLVVLRLFPTLLPILLQFYIYFREKRTNKAAERERTRDADAVRMRERKRQMSGKNRIRILGERPKRMAG